MPIERGAEWGRPGSLPADAPVAADDAAAAELVAAGIDILGVDQGDLARTLGVRTPYDRDATRQLLPVDALRVRIDGGAAVLAVAHVVIGRWHQRSVTAIMNAAFVGERNLAPRAHPGDGRFDLVEMTLSPVDRLKAQRRMATGSHVPHPDIVTSRLATVERDLPAARQVRVDGRTVGVARKVQVEIVVDAFTVAV